MPPKTVCTFRLETIETVADDITRTVPAHMYARVCFIMLQLSSWYHVHLYCYCVLQGIARPPPFHGDTGHLEQSALTPWYTQRASPTCSTSSKLYLSPSPRSSHLCSLDSTTVSHRLQRRASITPHPLSGRLGRSPANLAPSPDLLSLQAKSKRPFFRPPKAPPSQPKDARPSALRFSRSCLRFCQLLLLRDGRCE